MNDVKRKEVWLHKNVISRLEKLAKEKKWSLKFYMEDTLAREAEKKPLNQLNSK